MLLNVFIYVKEMRTSLGLADIEIESHSQVMNYVLSWHVLKKKENYLSHSSFFSAAKLYAVTVCCSGGPGSLRPWVVSVKFGGSLRPKSP